MAPAAANTPRNRRKRDDQHLAHIGQEGRKTGITVREHERDEDGFEDPGEFFSSASKAPTTGRTAQRLRKSIGSELGSGDMEIASSPAPSPADVLSSRRAQSNGHVVPQSRSPLKTNLGATPRRPPSVGAQNARYTPQSAGPGSAASRAVPLLDFSTGATRSSSRSALRDSAGSPRRAGAVTPTSYARNSLSLTPSPERGRRMADASNDLTGNVTEGDDAKDLVDEASFQADTTIAPDEIPIDDTFLDAAADEPADALMNDEDPVDDEIDAREEIEEDAEADAVHDAVEDLSDEAPESSAQAPNQGKRPRGRPPKKAAQTSAKQPAGRQTKAKGTATGRRGKGQPSSSVTETTARGEFARPALPGVRRPLQRPRGETPFEEDDHLRTRSGRISFKPLAGWKGERVERVFPSNDPDSEFPEIRQILRMEDATPVKRPRRPIAQASRPGKRKKREQPTVFEEEADPEDVIDTWEADDGIIEGLVRTWNSRRQTSDEDLREDAIAYSAASIQAHDNGEGSFKFAKTLTMPFFGSGIVELPPGGFKRMKNSRKMQMMFFVHYGKVTVRVAENEFAITKGGAWQVPRGNFYSIENETGKPAKIFFSQGCEVEADSRIIN